MSGYREKDRSWFWRPADKWSLPFISARLGFGLVPVSLGILVTGGSLILSAIAALLGAALLAYGLRKY